MNEKEIVEYIKVHKVYPRNFYDYLNYSIFILPLSFAFIGLTILRFLKEPMALITAISLILFAILFSIFFHRKLNSSRRFRCLKPKHNLTLDKVNELIKSNFKLVRATVNYELNKIDASEPMTFFSYGSEITLLFDIDEILVNVRVGPFFQPFTLFRDKRNLKKIINLLT